MPQRYGKKKTPRSTTTIEVELQRRELALLRSEALRREVDIGTYLLECGLSSMASRREVELAERPVADPRGEDRRLPREYRLHL